MSGYGLIILFLQLVQYIIKLVIPFLRLRARLQHRAGLRSGPMSSSADRCTKLDRLLGDSRTLWRFWGSFQFML